MYCRNHLIDVGRLSRWRAPLSKDARLSVGAISLVFAGAVLAQTVSQFFLSTGAGAFSFYGVNSIIASTALDFAVVVFFARTPTTLRNLVLIYAATIALSIIMTQVFGALGSMTPGKPASRANLVVLTFELIAVIGSMVWQGGAIWQAFKHTAESRRPRLRAFACVACFALAAAALPVWPVFVPKTFDRANANLWEFARGIWDRSHREADFEKYAEWTRRAAQRAANIEARQPSHLEAALASVERRDPGKSNVFLIGLSGYSDQDVFEHETRQSIEILKSHFDIGNRVVQLVNADDAIDRDPVASIENLGIALRGIGARMDPAKDVLILTMTSHGSTNGLALHFKGLMSLTLDPDTLKTLLDEAGIKNRVLIVAACYSGTFVPVLANDDTMIMTAASSTRTSFGCANGREWTYFGDALFTHGLRTESTLVGAFRIARKTISQWETEQHLTPSDPQIVVGAAIARRFPGLIGEIRPDEAALPTTATRNKID